MTLDFCGIGNACIDIVAKVDDQFLVQWNFPKGNCAYIDLATADRLEKSLPAPQYVPGGCSANTAAVIAALGGTTSFIGRLADDTIGHLFLNDLKARGVHYASAPDTSAGAGSTRVFAMTTPDAERTFASYYGVQRDLSVADLDPISLQQARYVYLDGYALNADKALETFLRAAALSHEAGNMVVFNPNDISILTRFEPEVEQITKVSHGFICNSDEALLFTKRYTVEDAVAELRKQFRFGAVTNGAQPVHVFDSSGARVVPTFSPKDPVVDTNGAGDAFAGGFLFGLARGFTAEKAATLGNLCAGAIITHYGARPLADYQPFIAQVS